MIMVTERTTPFICEIYVNEKEIYSGDLNEVPEKFRKGMKRDLTEWAGSLGKRGLNELIYSHLAWYEHKGMFCENCGTVEAAESMAECTACGDKLGERYLYERNERLDMIITCVGMISSVRITEG